jgi:type IV pilus assembly protein PilM
MKLKSDSAFISVPGFSGLITIIELPEMPEGELAKALQFEAHKYIPSSLDEIAMSWEVIEHERASEAPISQTLGKGTDGRKIKVLLVAAPKKEIERYDKLVASAKLKVSAIELETFSLIRALIGNDAGNFLIIDIGSRVTSIVLVEKGVILVNRSIDAGGDEITTAISENMNISKQRAEDFKKGEKDLLNGKDSYLVIPILEFVISESKRILNAYRTKSKDARIDGVLLSGGTSKMKGIEEYFTHALDVKATLGNPWRRIGTQENVQPFVKNLGGSFTIALGLALRGIEEYKRE